MTINYKIKLLVLSILTVGLFGSCSKDETPSYNFKDMLVEFDVKSSSMNPFVKAEDNGEIWDLPAGSRFAIKMYYDDRSTTEATTVFQKIENSYMHVTSTLACEYTDNTYNAVQTDPTVNKFYWNNRKDHAFLAFFLKNEAAGYAPSFGDSDEMTFDMTDQKDPMLAISVKKPASGSNDANKVPLIFEHQVSKVQVKVKPDYVSVGLGEEQVVIESISLLGVASSATVYTSLSDDGTHTATQASDEEIEKFEMTLDDEPMSGYKGSSTALAFGNLKGIGVDWIERREGKADVSHSIDYFFPDTDIIALKSGKKYVFSVNLRRGTIVTMNLDIVDWGDDTTENTANGIIDTDN